MALLLLVFPGGARGQQPPAAELEQRMRLATVGAVKEGGRSAGDWAAYCREQIPATRTYRTWLIKRDFSMPHLQARNYAYVEWWLDVVRPDRIHVLQTIYEAPPLGELREERIEIGSQKFLSGSSWTLADAQAAADYAVLSRFLLLDKYTEMLNRSKFTLLGTVQADGRRYAVLESDNPRITGHPMLSEFETSKGRARVWIEAETGLLAKVELEYRGKDAGDNPLHKAFVQVFADYDQPLTINPPSPK